MGKKIVILDYGSGNVKSVFNLCSYLNDNVAISNEVKDIKNSSHIILPGVGSYNAAMKKIHKNLPVDNILEQLHNAKKPFLGICVGMQVLSDYGFEFEKSKGLGLINGSVKLLKTNTLPLPNIGWNEIKIEKKSPLFKNIDDKDCFYFVHSYCFYNDNKDDVIATTEYNYSFVSAIHFENIYGVQFHPEKSHNNGEKLLHNFALI